MNTLTKLILIYLIDDYKSKGEWKIQLEMRMILVSFIIKIKLK